MKNRLTPILIIASALWLFGLPVKAQTIGGSVYGGGNEAKVTGNVKVEIEVGSITGSVYGGGKAANVEGIDTVYVTGGSMTSVYGGGLGETTRMIGDVAVIIGESDSNSGATIGDVYGGSAKGKTNCTTATQPSHYNDSKTDVILNAGTINGSLYGGGHGIDNAIADVYGPVQVTVNGGKAGSVYGCNNAAGAPQSTVKIDINGTDAPGTGSTYAINNVYGGGNNAAYSVVNQKPQVIVHNGSSKIGNVFGSGNNATVPGTDVVVYGGTIGDVYGGGNNAGVSTTSGISVQIHGGTINRVFAGNNAGGSIPDNSSMGVTVNKATEEGHTACELHVTELYGGGNEVAGPAGTLTVQNTGGNTEGIGTVFGGANAANITNNVNLTLDQGRIITGIYGGNNSSGTVQGNITVTLGGAAANQFAFPTVYGGGYGASTETNGNVTVTVGTTSESDAQPILSGDVYGGSALGSVNNEATDETTVNIFGGTINGNVYGGGLGETNNATKGMVKGLVTVNIGTGTMDTEHPTFTASTAGNAVFGTGSSIYGCNNTGGSPQQNVMVNIYKTAHTAGINEVGDNGYAIANVFGGGNEADFTATGKTVSLNIYGCDNTIRRSFGGGNAAATQTVNTHIQGGRIYQVFGGGNGERGSDYAADVNGDVNLGIHGGLVGQFFGGSNQNGNITGSINLDVDDSSPCPQHLEIDEFFCGGNFADIIGGLETTITCSEGMKVNNLYGGCNMADIYGNVVLNLEGGEFVNVFGGSKGDLASLNNPALNITNHIDKAANIKKFPNALPSQTTSPELYAYMNAHPEVWGKGGNVTLNLKGGTTTNAFGGSNVNGNIEGLITVNLIKDDASSCQLVVDTIYGSGQDASYTPVNLVSGGKPIASPQVNIKHGTVGHYENNNTVLRVGCVFGGGKGETATVTSHPKVVIGDNVTTHTATVLGNVFGGGNAAAVVGTDTVLMQKGTVAKDIYGGGNLADVSGSVVVNVSGGTVTQDVYGGGALADVNVTENALTPNATTKVILDNGSVRDIYGGGLGSREGSGVAAKVYGDVTVNINNGSARNVFGCNNENGAPQNGVLVKLEGTATVDTIFGGGNLAAYSGSPDLRIISGTVKHKVIGGGNQAGVGGGNVSVSGGTIGTVAMDGNGIYGGCNNSGIVSGDITVNVTGGAIGASAKRANIHGGGYGHETTTSGNVTVTFGAQNAAHQAYPALYGDLYGGSGFGDVNGNNKKTIVNILNGEIIGDVYGGGLGSTTPNYAALVNGDVEVYVGKTISGTLYGMADIKSYTVGSATKGGNVFGCNNVNGTPKGTVAVTVNSTNTAATGTYAIQGVYGGGNVAHYDPTAPNTSFPTVTINNCSTSVKDVFGGGNAAAVTKTNVIVNGGNIDRVFAGGNGESGTAANVGYKNADSNPTSGSYGPGTANATIKGGTINKVFGGSNSLGTIRANGQLDIAQEGSCQMHITEVYGGGNLAAGAPATVNIGCTGTGTNDVIDYVYGGANNAAVNGNIELNIKGGRINNVFGGNNNGGAISGTVTVNVNWDDNLNCGTNGKYLGNVYGGGNVAPYSNSGNYPEVNILKGTVSTNVFGGGLGEAAVVTGNPVVNINGGSVVGKVFGGGSAAPVSGNPTVNAYKGSAPTIHGGGLGNTATVTGNPKVVVNKTADQTLAITTVYGGGDAAPVAGNTTVQLKKGSVTDTFGGGNQAVITGNTTVSLEGATASNLYGGGNLAGVTQTTTVNVSNGTVSTNVYGGCNNSGTVGSTTLVSLTGGTVQGSAFGGGFGSGTTVSGKAHVDVNGANAIVQTDVYGGGNQGVVNGGTYIKMLKGQVTGSVYGGGKEANVQGIDTVYVAGGTIGTNVYGGGLGESTRIMGNVAVIVGTQNATSGATISGDVYGGSAKGKTNCNEAGTAQYESTTKTEVILNKGVIAGSLYGGGHGPNGESADVWGPVSVQVYGGSVNTSVYGCNNAAGAPQSTVAVDIYGTDAPASGYALANVFGGGNQAAYGGTPAVTVHNCANSIGYVYGGGNQASVAATNVNIYGGNTIGYVFGGGNGQGVAPDYTMVSGNAVANIYGGTIEHVFGGNNSSGSITGTVTVKVDKQTETGHNSCDMKVGEVYGGGNLAAGNAGTITIGCTGTWTTTGTNNHTNHDNTNNRIGYELEGIGTVYGGANQANVSNGIDLNIENGIIDNVFGGNNTSGNISDTIRVTINKNGGCDWYVGNVFGGGNLAKYAAPANKTNYPKVRILNGTVSYDVFGGGLGSTGDAGQVTGHPQVTVNGAGASVNGGVYGGGSLAPTVGNPVVTLSNGTLAKVFGGGKAANVNGAPTVNINGGTVSAGVYGGCDSQGTVSNDITVAVTNGTIGTDETHRADIYGGGYGAGTATQGDVTVNFGTATSAATQHTEYPKLFGDIYGGSALGSVNEDHTNTTMVNVMNGTLKTHRTSGTTSNNQTYYTYAGGNVFGGGLGEEGSDVKGKVNGRVVVNIGAVPTRTRSLDSLHPENDTLIGQVRIEGNVYGCNNTSGSPQDSVMVNIYRTYMRSTDTITYTENDATYAIANVFGGGNKANYVPATTATNKKLKVMVHGCFNTIERVFGGSNAAAAGASGDTVKVVTDINGGRFNEVFGGGNGEVSAANIFGSVDLGIHGGLVNEFYVGSNNSGTISGASNVTVDQTGGCEEVNITEFYCGGKYADFVGDINATITCSQDMHVTNLYGGCKEAHVKAGNGGSGNIHLTVVGGTFENVYGGSRGTQTKGADIEGNITLDIFGGTITKAIYGGSNVKGAIGGTITVNVEDKYPNDNCSLEVSTADVYGGGNQADYPGVPAPDSPITGTITHTSPYNYPEVNIKNATVKNVFGGGLNATVTGNPQIFIKKGSKVLGNVYGGGNMGEVNGNPRVIVNGKQTN